MTTTMLTKKEEIRPFFEDLFEIAPFGEVSTFRRRMNSFLDSVMRPTQYQELTVPPMDLYKKNGSYIIEVALPGLEKKDIDIDVDGNCLTVSGKYSKEVGEKEKQYHYRELRQGSFSRSVSFPENLDPEKVIASFEKGILKVEVPSLRPTEVKKVAIQ